MTSHAIGAGASYRLDLPALRFLKKSAISFKYDRMMFDSDNFRDLRVTGVEPGSERLYGFDADVIQFFVSGWF